MRPTMLALGLFVLCLSGSACGDDDSEAVDAARAVDAASTVDSVSPVDAQGAADATTVDATTTVDASSPDAQSADAASDPDARILTAGDTCTDAADVTAGGTFAGTTATQSDALAPSGNGCPTGGAASGKDAVYFVEPAAQTTYKVTVVPEASFDPMLYVISACAPVNGCLAGTVLNGKGVQESVTFTAPASQRQNIVVDGELFSSGSYTITVEIL